MNSLRKKFFRVGVCKILTYKNKLGTLIRVNNKTKHVQHVIIFVYTRT